MLILLFLSAAFAAGIFAENNFKIINKYVTLDDFSKKHFEFVKITNLWYNRTTRVFGCEMKLIQDITDKWTLDCRIYKFRNNDYHPFLPMDINIRMVDAVNYDYMGIGDIFRKNHIPFKLPVPAAKYQLRDIYVDISKAPPVLLAGKYKVQTTVFDGKSPTMKFTWYGSLDEKVANKG